MKVQPQNRLEADQRKLTQSLKPYSSAIDKYNDDQYVRRSSSHSSRSISRSRSRGRNNLQQHNNNTTDKYNGDQHVRRSSSHSSRSMSRSRSRGRNNLQHHNNNGQVKDAKMNYAVGDSLQSDNDIIRDTNVENILQLEPFEHAFVRRSGGKWTYSIVTEVNEREMKFVLDVNGSKKKVDRNSLLHNVRRLNYAALNHRVDPYRRI